MISSCRPAGPIVSTVFTSSSEQGMPTSRSLILRQVGAASAGVKVVGVTVTPPASALLPASGEMITEPPAPVGDEPPEPLLAEPPEPLLAEPPEPLFEEPPEPLFEPPEPLLDEPPPEPLFEPPEPLFEEPPEPLFAEPPEPLDALPPIWPLQPVAAVATSISVRPIRRNSFVNMLPPGASSADARVRGKPAYTYLPCSSGSFPERLSA